MYTLEELKQKLIHEKADYELIVQSKPIYSLEDAAAYYDIDKAAPTFILQSENGLLACIVSSHRGKLDLDAIKEKFKFEKLKMADRKKIEKETGYSIGAVPLIGHHLPCLFDDALLQYDYIYGGTGEALVTLKINPHHVKKINQIIGVLESH